MSLPRYHVGYSIEEYLAIDRASEDRYEYLDGEIYAMAGESPQHGIICTNLVWLLHGQLKDGSCYLFSKDTKVLSGPKPKPGRRKGLFSYPDIVSVCDEMQFYDERQDVLLNPIVVIEVASPNTEEFDHNEKWMRYQMWLRELTDYVMVAQDERRIEQYTRGTGSEWKYSVVMGRDSAIQLKSINCSLKRSDVYARVVFPEDEAESDRESS